VRRLASSVTEVTDAPTFNGARCRLYLIGTVGFFDADKRRQPIKETEKSCRTCGLATSLPPSLRPIISVEALMQSLFLLRYLVLLRTAILPSAQKLGCRWKHLVRAHPESPDHEFARPCNYTTHKLQNYTGSITGSRPRSPGVVYGEAHLFAAVLARL
jgi:hypothetical protein